LNITEMLKEINEKHKKNPKECIAQFS